MSFTTECREELAHAEPGDSCCRVAETSALLRLGGTLQLRGGGGGLRYELITPVGAVARRLKASLRALHDVDTDVEVHQQTGLQAAVTYRVATAEPALPALVALGLVDGARRPREGVAAEVVTGPCDAAAYVRGAFMATGSLSSPGQAPHLELLAPGEETAAGLARLVAACGGHGAHVSARQGGVRVVLKSGEAIGALLARVGAHRAFLAWDDARLRRELRAAANRAANADRANLRRAVTASSRQAEAIEQGLRGAGWADVPAELQEVALARLANPEASLAELGQLLDPPVGKTTVHRRLSRLMGLVAAGEGSGQAGWVE